MPQVRIELTTSRLLFISDYETDALPTALLRLIFNSKYTYRKYFLEVNCFKRLISFYFNWTWHFIFKRMISKQLPKRGNIFNGIKSHKKAKNIKRIAPSEDRTHDLQITLYFRLWDWRATYCAIEALIKLNLNLNFEIKNSQTLKLISV